VIIELKDWTLAADYLPDGFVSGWINGAETANFTATISKPGLPPERLFTNIERPDVLSLGLTSELICGFRGPIGFRIIPGDFFRIAITSEGGDEARYSFLAGSEKDALEAFDRLEFPRGDFAICSETHSDLLDQFTTSQLLKVLIIRLRRGVRGLSLSSRGGFKGFDYPMMDLDFALLTLLVKEYPGSVNSLLRGSARYLFSLNDTWSDLGKEIERLQSNLVGSFMFWERSHHTLDKIRRQVSTPNTASNQVGQTATWGGMATHQLSSDDALDVYLSRIWNVLKESDLWFHHELTLQVFDNPVSLNGQIISLSDYYSQSWPIYRARLENRRDSLIIRSQN
jgi:hypothetical protein